MRFKKNNKQGIPSPSARSYLSVLILTLPESFTQQWALKTASCFKCCLELVSYLVSPIILESTWHKFSYPAPLNNWCTELGLSPPERHRGPLSTGFLLPFDGNGSSSYWVSSHQAPLGNSEIVPFLNCTLLRRQDRVDGSMNNLRRRVLKVIIRCSKIISIYTIWKTWGSSMRERLNLHFSHFFRLLPHHETTLEQKSLFVCSQGRSLQCIFQRMISSVFSRNEWSSQNSCASKDTPPICNILETSVFILEPVVKSIQRTWRKSPLQR